MPIRSSRRSRATKRASSKGTDGTLEYYTEEQFRARGVDPIRPTTAKPGSEAKVLMLAARYAAGLPLWHHSDCYDHGPHVESQT